MSEIIKAYKGFDKDLKCRNFQYEIGKEYETDNAKVCECGFHACEYPLDVFGYYPPARNRFCEVEQSGVITRKEEKHSSTRIKISAELNIAGLCKAAIDYTRSRCTNECNAQPGEPATAGEYGAATAGSRGAATAGYAGAATAGEYGAATAGSRGAATAGSRGAATAGSRGAATAGEYGAATAGYAGAATAGEYGAATSRGKSSTGDNGVCVARGNNVMVKGGLGSLLVIAEENEGNFSINAWKAVVVDGVKIKADTWYMLVDGELKEAEE